jgi:hypothetical protein
MEDRRIYDLVPIDSPNEILDEVKTILGLMSVNDEIDYVVSAFDTTVKLYKGNYPGYRECNTRYHDFSHVSATFLAMAR